MSSRSQRKLWVCERGATATSVSVQRGELVDDVKTLVLARYANSLGKALDAANLAITIKPRVCGPPACHERLLDPDEDVCHVLDSYFPGGQKLAEALLVATSLPSRRNSSLGDIHNARALPAEATADSQAHGKPGVPATPQRGLTIREIQPTPQSNRKQLQENGLTRSVSAGNAQTSMQARLKAESAKSARDLFNTGRVSPRPQTARRDSSPSEDASSRRPLSRNSSSKRSPFLRSNPEDRSPSSYFPPTSARRSRPNSVTERPALSKPNSKHKPSSSLSKPAKPKSIPRGPRIKPLVQLDGAIPPINVLIAEDNSLVSRVVSKQMQQLNVRWDTATNGLEAVNKWKAGKFHLIFMDIGMPVMDGLAATKEIRRLERGESDQSLSQPKHVNETPEGSLIPKCEDMNGYTPDSDSNESQPKGVKPIAVNPPQQRAPVIIVALTASSLPADRDSALNAGCNDFITKPLEQVWLAQKVKEWGCMQALIDFEEWRIWKGYQIRGLSG
ncbi:hypothetical protein Q7P37_011523 [Cladosporium fusiforme]